MSLMSRVKGALWENGEGTPPPSTQTPQIPLAQPTVVVTASASSVDPEVLQQTREAVFNIGGSPYTRFMAESKKLEGVIVDPTTRIRAVVTMLNLSSADLIGALQTTHSAALDQWKSQIARAKEEAHRTKIVAREGQMQALQNEDAGIQSQIAALQHKLQENSTRSAALKQEITATQGEMEVKARDYEAAIAATDAELRQTIATLQSIK
jgi:hypothetical protein